MPSTYDQTLRYLWGLRRLGSRPGLAVIEALLSDLGHPERSFRAIHVTGSKGKGSTAAICASVLKAAGWKTGLYTSPHLLSYRERVAVDGAAISMNEVAELVDEVRGSSEALRSRKVIEREPTFFEVTTAMAFLHFQRSGVEVAAIEVGLGGRLDATNTIAAPVCAVTTLELEHTDVLGPEITDVAKEKAGIFHRGAWAVTGVEEGEGLNELRRQAFHLGVPLWILGEDVKVTRTKFDHASQYIDILTPRRHHAGLMIPLLGQFQVRNAGVAAAALDLFEDATGRKIPDEAYSTGFSTVSWPGRLERLSNSPPFYADAAHTEMSAKALCQAIGELEPQAQQRESTLIFSSFRDKKVDEILETLSSVASTVILTGLKNDRAMPLKQLEFAAKGHFQRILLVPDVRGAVQLAREATLEHGLMLATGSIYLVSEVMSLVGGFRVEEPGLSDPALSFEAERSSSARSRGAVSRG